MVFTPRYNVMLQGFAVFSDISPRGAVNIPVQLVSVNISSFLSFFQKVGRDGTQDSLHHSKMFFTVVCLEEGCSKIILNENTADTPDITGMVPAQVQNDFWSTIVTS